MTTSEARKRIEAPDHLLHLWVEYGDLSWRIQCLASEGTECSQPTLVENPKQDEEGFPQISPDPPECWLAEHLPLFLDDWGFEEIFESLSLDPIRSPVPIKVRVEIGSDAIDSIEWEVVE